MSQWSAEDFTPHVGTTFTLADAGLELELAAVHPETPSPGSPVEQPFTLEFRCAQGPVEGQGTGRLSHPVMGDVELFLVARQPVDGAGVYEAVFA